MDNNTFNNNLSNLVEYHLALNGDPPCIYRLTNDGGRSYIDKWECSLPMPTDEFLSSYDLSVVNDKINDKKREQSINDRKIKCLNDDMIKRVRASDGMIVYNTTLMKLMVFFNGTWR